MTTEYREALGGKARPGPLCRAAVEVGGKVATAAAVAAAAVERVLKWYYHFLRQSHGST